jgi:hypothetical protein
MTEDKIVLKYNYAFLKRIKLLPQIYKMYSIEYKLNVIDWIHLFYEQTGQVNAIGRKGSPNTLVKRNDSN